MPIVITWVIFCVLIGMLSNSRGQGFALGFFLSLILSPIIGLIIVLVSKDNSRVTNNNVVFQNTYTCKWCGFTTNRYSDFCPHCAKNSIGKTMKEHFEETGISYINNSPVNQVPGAIFACKYCGFQTPHYSEYCTSCGKNIAGKTFKELLEI